jgi:DNA-binding transcriptional ArsR family regulator
MEKDMVQELDAELLRDLGQFTRLQILEFLLKGEKNVTEIQTSIGSIPQGRLSTHLT